ncbi:MAG: PilZ domain-containing protein [Polyangiaceae bacterium]
MLGVKPDVKRRNLTPPTGAPVPGLPPTRRAGGARREVSDRVYFYDGDSEIVGWALNLSRGGLRAIIEESLQLGAELQVAVGEGGKRRPGRIVWIQDEPDGAIVGVSFLDDTDSQPPPPAPPAPPTRESG